MEVFLGHWGALGAPTPLMAPRQSKDASQHQFFMILAPFWALLLRQDTHLELMLRGEARALHKKKKKRASKGSSFR